MKNLLKIIPVTTVALCNTQYGFAQEAGESLFDRNRNVSVEERPKPEYNTDGIRRGVWLFQPQLNLRTEFDDNVFAENINTSDDIILIAAPSINIELDRNVHGLNIFANADTRQYLDFDSENQTNYGIGFEGRLDVQRGANIRTGLTHRKFHENRRSSGVGRVSSEPISADQTEGFLRGSRERGRTRVQAEANFVNVNYSDVILSNGQDSDQDFRDRDDIGFSLRGDYAISPDRSVFARIRYVDQDYRESGNQVSRDQNGYVIEGGLDFDLTNLVRGEIGVGYLNRSFDSDVRQDFDGLSYTGQLEWFATPLITISANGSRSIRASELLNSPSIVTERVGINADYEWRRNIVLSLRSDFIKDNYRDIDREDEWLIVSAGVNYLLNRYIALTGNVEYTNSDSRGMFLQPDFDNTRVIFGVTFRR